MFSGATCCVSLIHSFDAYQVFDSFSYAFQIRGNRSSVIASLVAAPPVSRTESMFIYTFISSKGVRI